MTRKNGGRPSATYVLHFLEQAHMATMAYNIKTNSLSTSYFSIIYSMQAIKRVVQGGSLARFTNGKIEDHGSRI